MDSNSSKQSGASAFWIATIAALISGAFAIQWHFSAVSPVKIPSAALTTLPKVAEADPRSSKSPADQGESPQNCHEWAIVTATISCSIKVMAIIDANAYSSKIEEQESRLRHFEPKGRIICKNPSYAAQYSDGSAGEAASRSMDNVSSLSSADRIVNICYNGVALDVAKTEQSDPGGNIYGGS